MEEWMNGFGGLSGLSGMIDPHQMGLFSLAAANNPQMMGPIFDQLGIPVPGSPGFAQFMGGGGGGELGGLINGTQVPAGTDTMPKPPALSPGVSEATAPLAGPPVAPPPAAMAPPLPTPPPSGVMPGSPAAQQKNPLSQLQGVRPPVAPTPQFQGGVTGSKAPVPDKVPQNSAAVNMLMQLMAGGGRQAAQIPALGQLLRG